MVYIAYIHFSDTIMAHSENLFTFLPVFWAFFIKKKLYHNSFEGHEASIFELFQSLSMTNIVHSHQTTVLKIHQPIAFYKYNL